MDLDAVGAWVRQFVVPTGAIEPFLDRPWAAVAVVPTTTGPVWFKECAPDLAFEVRLTAEVGRRSPDLTAEVLASSEERRWLLLRDAGSKLGPERCPPPVWEALFPRYAELQKRELPFVEEHLRHGVPDRRAAVLPALYDDFLREPMPIDDSGRDKLVAFAPVLAELCAELDACGVPDSVQHDDLHPWNVFSDGRSVRILDWGDACIGHPFSTVGVTFRFLEREGTVDPDHPVFARLRDCYLEPWGSGFEDVFDLALRVGALAHAVAWSHQRSRLTPQERVEFDQDYVNVLARALRMTGLI